MCGPVVPVSYDGLGRAASQLAGFLGPGSLNPVQFVTRLAGQCDAIATVKSGRLMFIKARQGTSGKPLPTVTITRQDGDQHSFSVADCDAYTGVTAYWQDNKEAEKKKIEVKRKKKAKPKEERPLVGDSENAKEQRHVYANQTNAMRAARAEWERLQRGVAEFQITLARGRPELYPEQPTTVRGFKPDIDAAPWSPLNPSKPDTLADSAQQLGKVRISHRT